ncbi:hypothetical protein KXR83_05775 [Williamsia muralis]|uniref:hypothetical protein n=1 Tax=Williamsia marianensis TaxID=85044 RepID=UPI003F135A65
MSRYNYRPNLVSMGRLLVGPELRRVMHSKAQVGVMLYQAQVKRDTGRNAREVRGYTEIIGIPAGGGVSRRWCGVIEAYGPYAAYREFGTRQHAAEHTLEKVARQIGRAG